MEQNASWEAYSRSSDQKKSHLLYNSKVHHSDYKMSPLEAVLSQLNPIHIFTPHF
jgi:hypothetical protein